MSKALVNIWERRRTSPPPAVTRAMRLGPLSAGVVDPANIEIRPLRRVRRALARAKR